MQDKFGDAFGEAWDALSDFAPSELANPEDLQYIADNDNDILIFSDAGAMVGRTPGSTAIRGNALGMKIIRKRLTTTLILSFKSSTVRMAIGSTSVDLRLDRVS